MVTLCKTLPATFFFDNLDDREHCHFQASTKLMHGGKHHHFFILCVLKRI